VPSLPHVEFSSPHTQRSFHGYYAGQPMLVGTLNQEQENFFGTSFTATCRCWQYTL